MATSPDPSALGLAKIAARPLSDFDRSETSDLFDKARRFFDWLDPCRYERGVEAFHKKRGLQQGCVMTRYVLLLGVLGSGLPTSAVVRAQGVAPSAAPAELSRRVFVEGSVLGSVDHRLVFEDRSAHETFDASWTLAAGGSFGVFLSEAWTLRAELEVPRWAGSDIAAYGGLYYPSATSPGLEFRIATARRDITLVGLVGHHMRSSGRVRPSLLIGGGLSHALVRENIEVQDPPGSPWTSLGVVQLRPDRTNPWTENNPTLTFGLDVEVLITQAFSLVPRVRASIAMGDTAAAILRPGIGARWRF